MTLPNTFIIGVQKAGTTSLHNWLSQHPDIFGPAEFKDVDYFANPDYERQIEKRFNRDYIKYNNEKIVLQSQVNYIFYPNAIVNIKRTVPEAKLIVILRDPVDRAISAYNYFKKMGREKRPPEKALIYNPKSNFKYNHNNSDFTYIEHGFYSKQLAHVYSYFSKENVLILQYDELKNNPSKLVDTAFRFLGVDNSFIPVFSLKNKTGIVKSKWLNKKLTSSSKFRKLFINVFINWWLSPSKRKRIKQDLIDLNTKNNNYNLSYIDKNVYNALKEIYKDEHIELRKMLNN